MSKVVVGMSGGVDSSVAAYLLKEQGYDVIGVTMQIWQDEEQAAQEENGGCCGLSAVDDARRVAAALEIPYYVMNFKKEFKENVIDYFVEEYQNGRTPNPCIACNRYVKWESLLIMLDMKGICASSGSACTSGSLDPSHVLLAIGLPHEIAHGSLRMTLGEETTREDLDYTVDTLKEIVANLRSMSPLYEDFIKKQNA